MARPEYTALDRLARAKAHHIIRQLRRDGIEPTENVDHWATEIAEQIDSVYMDALPEMPATEANDRAFETASEALFQASQDR